MEAGNWKIVTSIDGRIVPRGRASVSVYDNSLLYAEGLFEAFLAIDDRVVFAEDHYRRLYNGARVTGLKVPIGKARLKRWITEALQAHPERIKKVRLTITSGESAKWAGADGPPRTIISVAPHVLPAVPFKLCVSEFRIDQDSIFRRIKTLSYAIHAAALKRARRRRCDDALLLNELDNIAEVTSANIFWIRRGRLYTSPISSGCLEGVTRKILIREARKLGIPTHEKDETLPRLLDANEILVTSSLKLILPVGRIITQDRTYSYATGPVTKRLAEHFIRLIRI